MPSIKTLIKLFLDRGRILKSLLSNINKNVTKLFSYRLHKSASSFLIEYERLTSME